MPILLLCDYELKTNPFSTDVAILYHKIHKVYREQRQMNSKAVFGSNVLTILLKVCIMKKVVINELMV